MTGPIIASTATPVTVQPWLLELVDEALQHHHLAPSDVRACLLFGSRARGDERPDSDVDLIHIVRGPASAPLDYQRFVSAGTTGGIRVDTNAVSLGRLNEYGGDPHWAYRLCTTRPIAARCTDPMSDIVEWLGAMHQLIASDSSCRYRATVHLQNLHRLVARLASFHAHVPHLAFYGLTEIADVGPIVFLELCGRAPFQTGRPSEQIRDAFTTAPVALGTTFELLRRSLEDEARRAIPNVNDIDRAVTEARRACRRCIERRWPESYGRGLTFLFESDQSRLREIDSLLASDGMPALASATSFLDTLGRFVACGSAVIAGAPAATGATSPSRRDRSTRINGPRFVDYDRSRRRAKVILGTGGCRVPGCTFCMLPLLAHAKEPVDDALRRLRGAVTGPVDQVAVYTDGSFFDDRELSDQERRYIATTISGWGASEILVETLPRFVTTDALVSLQSALDHRCGLRIAIGLQSTDNDVRKYVTHTPIEERELDGLLQLRHVHPFSLRVYLLAGKCVMETNEDVGDVERSVDDLNARLDPSDVVTVNPLLPTEGTLVEALERARFFEEMSGCQAAALVRRLRAKRLVFRLEFGPLGPSTCTSLALDAPATHWSDGFCGHDRCVEAIEGRFGPATLPWSLLGPLAVRSQWADRLA